MKLRTKSKALRKAAAKQNDGQHDERYFVAALQDAIINLQHVQRGRQHQDIDDGAEDTNGPKRTLEAEEGFSDFVFWDVQSRFSHAGWTDDKYVAELQ